LIHVHSLLPGFILVLFRVVGLTLVAPVLGSSLIPARLKVVLSMSLAAVVFPAVGPTIPADVSLGAAVVGIGGEMLIGLVIGLGASIIVLAAEVAGTLVGQQAGIALASVFDPSQDIDTTVVGQIYMIVTTLVFLLIGGHRALVAALLDTFSVIPVLQYRMGEPILTLAADLLSSSYVLAVKLAGPVLIALLLTELMLAFVARTMPQLNILTVGFAARSIVAIGVAALALAVSQDLLVGGLLGALDDIRAALGLAPVG